MGWKSHFGLWKNLIVLRNGLWKGTCSLIYKTFFSIFLQFLHYFLGENPFKKTSFLHHLKFVWLKNVLWRFYHTQKKKNSFFFEFLFIYEIKSLKDLICKILWIYLYLWLCYYYMYICMLNLQYKLLFVVEIVLTNFSTKEIKKWLFFFLPHKNNVFWSIVISQSHLQNQWLFWTFC